MRTVFVNPRKRRSRKSRRRAKKASYKAVGKLYRRNAGIAPFVSNPLIMSNPPRRMRRRHSNPLAGLNLRSLLSKGLTYGGGAAVAVGANALFLNGISNFWARNGARFAGAVASTMFMKGELGAAAAGGMFYPIMQEVTAKFLGGKTTTGTEADLEGLAADLEDVMDELSDDDLEDDELYLEDDDDILG